MTPSLPQGSALSFFAADRSEQDPAVRSISSHDSRSSACQKRQADVVGVLRQELSDAERERHIQDAGRQVQAAYARYEASGDPAERQAARDWLTVQNAAIAARSEAQQARMSRVIDQGLDYFQTTAARDAAMLKARGLVG